MAMASPIWSKWPCVTMSRSHRSTVSAVRGLVGLLNQGSSRMVVPPAVVTSKQLWPYQVIVVPTGRPMRSTS